MRELIIRAWCDRCESLGNERTEAKHTYSVGIVKGETRPAPRVIELCDECDAAIDWLPKLLADHSNPLDPKARPAAAPQSAPAATLQGDREICRVCGRELGRSALIGHIWSQHRRGQKRPPPPSVCPECREVFEIQGMTMHRVLQHGFSPIEDAYKGLL
jgi:hypothetical protein